MKFFQFTEDLLSGFHDLRASGHVLKVYATNATPDQTADLVKADLAEITAVNGYPSGGTDVQNALSETGGTATVTGVDVTWTASGGSFGPLRYVVLYNDTQSSPADPLISYWDYGSNISINDGESLVVDFGASLFTLA